MAAIEVEGLTKVFRTGRRRARRTTVAVDGIGFEVAAGERLAFIGPNGAGKSTSIKILTGILHPTSGRASVLGFEPWTQRRQLASRIGTLFGQRSQLWAELPPRASLRMLAAIFDLDDRRAEARVTELGELLDATALLDQPVRTQSLGQRMVNHGVVISDAPVAQMRRGLLAAKRVEVGLDHPVDAPAVRALDVGGVTITAHTAAVAHLAVDTRVRSVRDVVDAVLASLPVADLSVVDPPLEEVIAGIYRSPAATERAP